MVINTKLFYVGRIFGNTKEHYLGNGEENNVFSL